MVRRSFPPHFTLSLVSLTEVGSRLCRTAWEKNKGLSQEEAKSKYVEYFLEFLEKNSSEEGAKHKQAVSIFHSQQRLVCLAYLEQCLQIEAAA